MRGCSTTPEHSRTLFLITIGLCWPFQEGDRSPVCPTPTHYTSLPISVTVGRFFFSPSFFFSGACVSIPLRLFAADLHSFCSLPGDNHASGISHTCFFIFLFLFVVLIIIFSSIRPRIGKLGLVKLNQSAQLSRCLSCI